MCKAKTNFGSIKSEDRNVPDKHGCLAMVAAPAKGSKPLNTSHHDIQALYVTDQVRSKSTPTDSRQVSVAGERTHYEVCHTRGRLHSNNRFALCHFVMMTNMIQAHMHMLHTCTSAYESLCARTPGINGGSRAAKDEPEL